MKTLLVILLFCGLQTANAKEKTIILTTKNVCTLDEAVDGDSMAKLKACLVDKVYLRKGRNYPIYLYINSGGGSIYDGLRFIAFAKTISNLHTITEFSASMAAAIVQHLPGKRYVVDHGVFMFHRARGGFRGQFEDGEIESRLAMWKKIVRKMEKVQADRIGITLADYKKRRINEWWALSDEAVKDNVADAIVLPKCSRTLAGQSYVQKFRSFLGGEITVKKSKCPMVN